MYIPLYIVFYFLLCSDNTLYIVCYIVLYSMYIPLYIVFYFLLCSDNTQHIVLCVLYVCYVSARAKSAKNWEENNKHSTYIIVFVRS